MLILERFHQLSVIKIQLYKRHWCKGNKSWFVDSGIIAQRLADQDFEEILYFQSMHLHKEAFEAIVQANVESIPENFESIGTVVISHWKLENIDAVVSNKLIELRKSPSLALVEEILKLEAFKDIKQPIVIESQMTIKYLKDVSTTLAVVSAVREVDLDHINYARHNTTYRHVYLNNLLRREKISRKIW